MNERGLIKLIIRRWTVFRGNDRRKQHIVFRAETWGKTGRQLMTPSNQNKNCKRHASFLRKILFLFMSVLVCNMAVAAEYDTDTFFWEGSLDPGKAIEIKGINGDIRAYASRGSNIEVEAVKIGRRGDPDEVVIEVVPHSDGITICAVYPNSGWGFSNECSPGRKGRMNVRD
jgi:hypothetical protein